MPGKVVVSAKVVSNGMSAEARQEIEKKRANFALDVGYRVTIREALLGYQFWSIFHAIPPMVWYYPLQTLDISGYEAFALVWLSPLLLIWPLKLLFNNRPVMALLRLATLCGAASFLSDEGDPLMRLALLAAGNGVAMLTLALSITGSSVKQRHSTITGLLLGYILMLVTRVWCITFQPIFFETKYTKIGLAFFTIATLDKILSGDDGSEDDFPAPEKRHKPSSISTAFGLGSILFLTQWAFGEASILTRWSITGYPETGPTPYPFGFLVILALCLGLLISSKRWLTTSSLYWLLFAAAPAAGLYFLYGWASFTCGLLLAIWTGSVMPEIFERVSFSPLVRTFVLGMLVYLVEIFFHVWTVAFNFVPGGELVREHGDWLLAGVCLLLAICLLSGKSLLLNTPYSIFVRTDSKQSSSSSSAAHSKPFKSVLLCLLLLAGGGYLYRYKNQKFDPPAKFDQNEFSAMIWTYHFGLDNAGWPSVQEAAELFQKAGSPDLIALLESDASKPFLGNNDLAQYFSETLGYYADFGPATKDHTWGNLLLSKYPIVQSQHLLLPSPEGELAPGIYATVLINGRTVDVLSTHMGNDRDDLDRKLQARILSQLAANTPHPMVFLGYLTSAPNSRDYKEFTEKGGLKDIDPTDSDRWCEYIFYKRLIRVGYARIAKGTMSDTELQMAKFALPEDPDSYKDNLGVTSDTKYVLPRRLFPTRELGNFHKGHHEMPGNFYHMSTPKYFVPDPVYDEQLAPPSTPPRSPLPLPVKKKEKAAADKQKKNQKAEKKESESDKQKQQNVKQEL